MSIRAIDVALLRSAVLFSLKIRRMGNRRQANLDLVNVGMTDKNRMKLSKQLIVSDELDAIGTFQAELYKWVKARSNPSFFRDGLYLVKTTEVNAFEEALKAARTKLQGELVPKLQEAYPAHIQTAKGALADQFNPTDYPDVSDLPRQFGVEWNWITIGVPENLPEELKAAEAAKIEGQFKAAEVEIMAAMREGFMKVVEHITERLTPDPNAEADAKPKIFRDTLFEDLTQFVETFSARNLVADADLAATVEKARAILVQVNGDTPDKKAQGLRGKGKDDGFAAALREQTAAAFAAVKAEAQTLLVDRPSRRFDLSSLSEAA